MLHEFFPIMLNVSNIFFWSCACSSVKNLLIWLIILFIRFFYVIDNFVGLNICAFLSFFKFYRRFQILVHFFGNFYHFLVVLSWKRIGRRLLTQIKVPFVYPLKTLENYWFYDVFRGYRNGILAWNGLINLRIIQTEAAVCRFSSR